MCKENSYDFKRYGTLTEEQALAALNSDESITSAEMENILFSLADATNDYIADLDEHIISEYSYYEGLFKGLDMALKLLNKLELAEN